MTEPLAKFLLTDEQKRALIPITPELMADAEVTRGLSSELRELLMVGIDHHLRPWKYPDPNPMPTFDPFPRITQAQRLIRETRERFHAAIDVLRYGPTHRDRGEA